MVRPKPRSNLKRRADWVAATEVHDDNVILTTPGRYGFHLPRVALRDQYYERLEAERAQKRAEQIAALSSQ